YGKTLSTNINDYIDTEQTNKDIVSDIKMDISKIKIEENKEYPAIGEYEIIFLYKDKEETLKLKVTDTTKPVFKDFKEEVEFIRDCKPSAEEFSKMFTAEDLDSTTVTVDDSKVDYSKEGEYIATVKAIDGSKNEVTQDIKVKITAPTIKLDKSKDTVYEGESLVLKADIKGKDTKATFKSSDEKVATVDSNGKVKAKDRGKATITATANGVEAKFNITVKAKPKNSSTEKKTVTNPNTGKKEEVTVIKPSKPSSSGGSGSSSTSSGGSSSSGGSVAMEYSLSKAKEAFNLQNAERAKAGLPSMAWNDTLYEACKVRAKEIVTNWSHTRPDGSRYSSLITSLPLKRSGENIAKGTTSPSNVVASWMASPGHKANILETNTHAAVAYYGGYWVTIFAEM
ncbi:CAP domain-containing protein, partial [Massilimicrobiota sp. An80]|uniref:CAP domain-containing protein n=1 Tax=Massilimicrobiota sp. An80 TaxID=1965658 RepID=UPI000B43C6D4